MDVRIATRNGRFGPAPWVAALAVVALGLASWPFTVDDAFIAARYADRIARGLGYTYNDGPPTDGVTGPLWLVPMIVGRWLGAEPYLVAKAVGLVCAAAAAFWTVRRARDEGTLVPFFAAAVVACAATVSIWSVAGLETGAATLAVVIAAQLVLAPREDNAHGRVRAVMAGLAIGSLAWLRPEVLVLGAALLTAALVLSVRHARLAVAVAGTGVLSVAVFRWALFASPMPMVLQAKGGSLGQGIGYALVGVAVVTGLAGGVLAGVAAVSSGDTRLRGLAFAIVAHVIAVAVVGGDWMPGYRLLVPMLPLYALLAAVGTAQLFHRGGFGARCVAVLMLGLACLGPLAYGLVQLPALWEAAHAREQVARPLARALAAKHASVALVDIGLVGYESGLEIVDLAGLTDPAIASAPGGHLSKYIDVGYLAARNPSAIVLHTAGRPFIVEGALRTPAGSPVERHVAGLPWVRRHFRASKVVRYAPAYYYVVLERTQTRTLQ